MILVSLNLTPIFENTKKLEFPAKILLLTISGIAVFYSLLIVIFSGAGTKPVPQFFVFFIIWGIEFFLLLKFTKIGFVAFPGASILFYLFVTNRFLRDSIGVINEYD